MRTTIAISITICTLTLGACGRTSAPARETSPPQSASSSRPVPMPMTVRQLQSNREAMAITRRLKGLPPVRLRLTSGSKSLRDGGIAPGIIIPGVDDLKEK